MTAFYFRKKKTYAPAMVILLNKYNKRNHRKRRFWESKLKIWTFSTIVTESETF